MTQKDFFAIFDKSVIYTERLYLRRLKVSDAEALYRIASEPEVSKYLLWDKHPTLKYTKRYLKNLMHMYRDHTYFEWGVFLSSNDELIGTCGFTAFHHTLKKGEIGYSFGVIHWGHGYATEAVAATIRFGFEKLSLERIEACYVLENEASGHVMYKCNMKYIGEGERMFVKGKEEHIGYYAISREEYLLSFEKNLLPI